jgi:hypothetical protein
MKWFEIRRTYPNQWLIIEALQAHTTTENQRELDTIAVMESCTDSVSAIQTYRRLHEQYPVREFYYVHTSRETLDIRERVWTGIRRGDAIIAKV